MEGDSGEKTLPLSKSTPALSQSKSKIDEKLAMMSPNNNRSLIETQVLLSPRSRRARNFKKTRHRSFDSIDVSGLPEGSQSYNNLINQKVGGQSLMMSPSKSNQSFDIVDDTPRSFTSFPSRSARSKNSKLPHPRSFDSLELPGLLLSAGTNDPSEKNSTNGSNHQRRHNKLNVSTLNDEDNLNNDKTTIAERLGMMAPNNSGRPPRTRRSSIDAAIFSMDLPSLSLDSDDLGRDDNDDNRKQDENASPSKSSDQIKGAPSLPSNNSDQSQQSAWTEMTVRSETYLQSNQDDVDSASTSSAYYSDGGIEQSYRSYSGKGLDFQDDENDDDSSNPNFNYMARDNGSHKTLSSAFSLNDMGSSSTVSSLSVDGVRSDLRNFDETPERQIQIIMSPTRQYRRQNRRTSSHSFGRRRRRFSNDSYQSYGSTIRSGDDLTEEEVMTQDSSMPEIPALPSHVSATEFLKRSYSASDDEVDHAEDVEEITVDDDDGEYIEEFLNEASENPDESTKRYEIVISDDSYIEEIVVEVEEEETEITLEHEYLNDTEPVANSRDCSDKESVDRKSHCSNNDEAQQTNSPDAIEKPEDSNNGDRRPFPNIEAELQCTVDRLDKTEGSPTADDEAECIADAESNDGANDESLNAQNE